MNNMYDILEKMNLLEGKASKPDFLDIDKDGDRQEPMKKAANEKVKEQMSNQQMLQQMASGMLKKSMRDTGMLDPESEPDTGAKSATSEPAPLKPQARIPGNTDPAKGPVDYGLGKPNMQEAPEAGEYAHRASPTFGHSRQMAPGYDPTFRSPINSPASSEVEELEYLMSKGAMTGAEEMRQRALANKFGIRKPEDMAKLPQLRQQELDRIEKTQAELQRKSAEANVASRDELERQRAARAGVTAQPRSDVSSTAGFRAAYDRAGRPQPAVRENQGIAEQSAFQFSPEQEAWLGKSDRQDPYILARMPGAKPPIDYFTNPEDRAIAQRLNFGQQNLNRIKSLVGAKPGDAEVFGTQSSAAPAKPAATTPSDISTPAGFRAAYDKAGSPAKGPVSADQSMAPNERIGATSSDRDSMTFSKAFADARAKGEKTFSWRGKRYAVKMAPRSTNAQVFPVREGEVEEGNEFTQARLAAIKAGKPTFTVAGKTYKVTGDTSDERSQVNEGYVEFMDKKAAYRKMGADVEGRSDDYTVTYKDGTRKRYQETERGRRVTTLEPVDAPEATDDEGNAVKRGRGRPKGTGKKMGARGKTRVSEQDLDEDYDRDEYDEEGEMAKSQSRTIADAAEELQMMIGDDENLPEWVQKKINLAKDYIDSARDYLAANRPGDEAMAEASTGDYSAKKARAGKDIGKPGKQFAKIAKSAAQRYGSKERGEKVAGAVLAKLRAKEGAGEELEEKAVSKAQRAAAGIAYAAKKGDIPKSELRGASKEMAKMPAGELKKFAKTKEKGLPEKKDEVDETTTAGSVATAPAAAPKGKKGMVFGKGVYEGQIAESFERKLNTVLTEGISITASQNEDGQKNLTVTATDDDAVKLAQLLQLAGMPQATGYKEACPTCGGMHEGECLEETDLANSPDEQTMDTDMMVNTMSGGLNGPKMQVNPNNMGDNPLAMRNLGSKGASGQINLGAMAEDIEQKLENRLMDLYKRIQ